MATNLKKLVKQTMDKTLYCSLATAEKGRVWVCPVAFAYDNQMDIYFISNLRSRHIKNIARNNKVAVAIYTTDQKVKGHKAGVQLEGTATRVHGHSHIERAYYIYFRRLPEWDDADVSYFKAKKAEWPLFKINTAKLFYFNNKLFGETAKRVL